VPTFLMTQRRGGTGSACKATRPIKLLAERLLTSRIFAAAFRLVLFGVCALVSLVFAAASTTQQPMLATHKLRAESGV
jgi:hypothetical protein